MASPNNKLGKYCSRLRAPYNPVNPPERDATFVPRPHQKRMLSALCRSRLNVFSVPRQVGTTTTLIAWLMWSAEDLGQRALYLSDRARCALDGHDKAAYLCPDQSVMTKNNKQHMEFKSGGSIEFYSASSEAYKSCTYDAIVIDNAAFVCRLDEVMAKVHPALACAGRMVLASCQNLDEEHPFTRMCVEADVGLNDFRHLRVTYRESWEGGDEELRESAMALRNILGVRRFIQEYGNYPSI